MPVLGAINAFLAIYNALPGPIQSFILVSLFCVGGVSLFEKVLNL